MRAQTGTARSSIILSTTNPRCGSCPLDAEMVFEDPVVPGRSAEHVMDPPPGRSGAGHDLHDEPRNDEARHGKEQKPDPTTHRRARGSNAPGNGIGAAGAQRAGASAGNAPRCRAWPAWRASWMRCSTRDRKPAGLARQIVWILPHRDALPAAELASNALYHAGSGSDGRFGRSRLLRPPYVQRIRTVRSRTGFEGAGRPQLAATYIGRSMQAAKYQYRLV